MPPFQSPPKQPALALTKDGDRIIAYALTPAVVTRTGVGVRTVLAG